MSYQANAIEPHGDALPQPLQAGCPICSICGKAMTVNPDPYPFSRTQRWAMRNNKSRTMANEIATDGQTPPAPSEILPSENVTPEETATPRTVRFADRERARLATEKVLRLHARLFEELAK